MAVEGLSIRRRGHDPVAVAIALAANRASKAEKLRASKDAGVRALGERFRASLDADVEALIAERGSSTGEAWRIRTAAIGGWS